MKKFLVMSLLLVSSAVFAKEPSSSGVVDALALANEADVAQFLKSGNRTMSITYKAISADEERYTLVRQSCSTNGLGPGHCLGGAQLEITLQAKIVLANRVKVGSSRVLLIK